MNDPKRMRRRIIIDYHWRRQDGKEINPDDMEELEEAAMERIGDMTAINFTEGDLNHAITTLEPEPDVEYTGWWSYNVESEFDDENKSN